MTKAFDLIGVDGTSSGWVASIGGSEKKCLSSINFYENLGKLLSDYPDSLVVIDMPVELNEKNHLRECDILAKRYLGRNFQSSVFIPPLKRVLKCSVYQEANSLSKKIAGKGLSKQSWHLKNKIIEVQDLCKISNKIYEGHPECSFKMLKNEPLESKKKTVKGIFERLNLLRKVGLDPLSTSLNLENNSAIKIDDVLDSMVLFITALRIIEGKHICLEKKGATNSDDDGKIFI